MFTHKAHVACNLCFFVENDGVLKVTGSHVHFKSCSVLKTVLDINAVHTQEVIYRTAF